MKKNTNSAKFPLGEIDYTHGVLEASNDWGWLKTCLNRHSHGDWGNIGDEAKAEAETDPDS